MNPNIIKEVEARVKATLKTLPNLVGNEVVNFAKDNFRRQGFLGDRFEAWPQRKASGAWGKTPRNKGRALLIDTGKLRRGTRVVSADWNAVKVGNAIPYAKAHNDGARLGLIQTVKGHQRKRRKGKRGAGAIQVKAHTRKVMMKMPQRRFLGKSQYLTRNIHRLIAYQIKKALK